MRAVIVKIYQHSHDAKTEDDEGKEKSVEGNTTKIHMMVDGLPIEFYFAGGEVHDCKVALALIDMLPFPGRQILK